MKKWSDPQMPTMDFSSCCLSKQDKAFLSGEWNCFTTHETELLSYNVSLINELFSDLEFNVEQAKDRVGKPKDDMDFVNEFDDDGDEEELNESNEEGGAKQGTRMMRILMRIWHILLPLLILLMIQMKWQHGKYWQFGGNIDLSCSMISVVLDTLCLHILRLLNMQEILSIWI